MGFLILYPGNQVACLVPGRVGWPQRGAATGLPRGGAHLHQLISWQRAGQPERQRRRNGAMCQEPSGRGQVENAPSLTAHKSEEPEGGRELWVAPGRDSSVPGAVGHPGDLVIARGSLFTITLLQSFDKIRRITEDTCWRSWCLGWDRTE